jgi:ornithine carbamoyltransferase
MKDFVSIRMLTKEEIISLLHFAGEGVNICSTWFEIAGKLDLNLTQVCPKGYEPKYI